MRAPSDGRTRAAAILALFAALTIVNSYPLALRPGSIIGQHGDAWFSVWRLAWVAHQLRTDPRHLFDANIYYPEPATLAYSDAMLLPATILAPLNWAGMHPVVIYNVTLLAAFFLSAVAAYLLVRHLTGSTAAGLLAGLVYAFSPHRLDHFDHLELQFAFWIPLAMLAWHRAVTREATRDFSTVALLASCQVLSSIYHGIFLLVWLGIITVLWFIRTPARALKAVGIMLLPPLLVLAVYSVPYLEARSRLGERDVTENLQFSARMADYLSAPANSVLYGRTERLGGQERHLFPGIAAAVLAIVAVWPPLDRVRLLYAVAGAAAIQLTLGFNGVVYPLLYEWVLPLRGLRVPARADILVLLATATLAGFGLARVMATASSRRVAVIVGASLIGFAGLEYLARPHFSEVDRRESEWYRWLPAIPDAVVFEWPVTVPWRLHEMIDVRYMYRSRLHWRPLLNGYSGHYPHSYTELLLVARSFPDTNSLAYLRQRGATVLIVHELPDQAERYEAAVERLVRDPNVTLFARDTDAGMRITFFRLARPE